jgi:hypothetical protein
VIANAGVMGASQAEQLYGVEKQFWVNHVAHLETRPANSTSHIEEEKPTCRHAIGARKQSRKHS